MTIKLKNGWNYQGDNWWQWHAFLDDEGTGELDQVDYVEYVLHSTFPKPVRRVDDPAGGFAMKTSGWGIFELKAFVYMKGGGKVKLKHDLQLYSDPPEGVTE